MHRLTTPILALFIAPLGFAQETPPIEVTDLIRSASPEGTPVQFVRRSARPERRGSARFPSHGIPSEWSLLPDSDDSAYSAIPRTGDAPMTKDQLSLILDSLLGSDASFELEGFGGRQFVQTDRPQLVRTVLEDIRRSLNSEHALSLTLTASDGNTSRVLVGVETTVQDGEVRSFGVRDRKSRLSRFEPEVALGSSIGDPQSEELHAGAMVLLRVRALPFSERIVVECMVRDAQIEPAEPMVIHSELGPLDRVRRSFAEAGSTFTLLPGEARRIDWRSGNGQRHQLELAIGARVDRPTGSVTLPVAATNLTNTDLLGFEFSVGGEGDPRTLDLQALLERTAIEADDLLAVLDRGGEGRNGVLAFTRGPEGEAQAARLGARLETLTETAMVQVELSEADGETRSLWSLGAPMIAELPSCFAIGRDQNLLAEHDTEIAQGARMLSPDVTMLETGSFVTLTPRIGAGGRIDAVSIELDSTKLDEVRTVMTTVSSTMQANMQTASTILLPPDTIPVELPELTSMTLRETLRLDDEGKATTRIQLPTNGRSSAGRSWILSVQVSKP